VGDEHVVLFEAAFVEKHGNALTGGVLALVVLSFYAFFPAAKTGFFAFGNQAFHDVCQ